MDLGHTSWDERSTTAARRAATGAAQQQAGGLDFGLIRATGFIHYLLDRGIYRMSDPQLRAAAPGLLTPR